MTFENSTINWPHLKSNAWQEDTWKGSEDWERVSVTALQILQTMPPTKHATMLGRQLTIADQTKKRSIENIHNGTHFSKYDSEE